jgi:hypothetical protein
MFLLALIHMSLFVPRASVFLLQREHGYVPSAAKEYDKNNTNQHPQDLR